MIAVSAEGIALWIGVISAALVAAYALIRKTHRQENSADVDEQRKQNVADAKVNREEAEANEEYLRRQREKDRQENAEFIARVEAQLAEYHRRVEAANDGHVNCRQELAQVRGELIAANKRIADLEARLERAGVE